MSNITEVKPSVGAEDRPQWNSHIGFILASLGSAVGLGNIWRFPYVMGKYGGGAFLLVYMVLMCAICIVPLLCELFLGKKFQHASVEAYTAVNSKLRAFGWLNVFTVIIIAAFYFAVGGWIIHYVAVYCANLIPFIGDALPKGTNYSAYFSAFSAKTFLPLIYTFLFLFFSAFFPYRGVNKGIEKANKIMMPAFLLMLLALVLISQTLPGAKDGLEFIFKPDFSKFNAEMFLIAFGQALFSLSVGMGAMITYGSYLKKETNLVESSYTIIFGETLIAISAGLMIFPAVFTYGLNPAEGPGLVFVTLPQVFEQLPVAGNIIAVIFFILLLFAALTSSISILETAIAVFRESLHLSRQKATVSVSLIVALLSIPCTLSFGLLKNFKFLGKTVFDLFDFTTSNVFLPFNTLLICLVVGYLLKPSDEIVNGNKILYFIFNILIKYVVPVLLIFSLLCGLHIINI
jgi:NSS family neurotransmitter:Na+ symporter